MNNQRDCFDLLTKIIWLWYMLKIYIGVHRCNNSVCQQHSSYEKLGGVYNKIGHKHKDICIIIIGHLW